MRHSAEGPSRAPWAQGAFTLAVAGLLAWLACGCRSEKEVSAALTQGAEPTHVLSGSAGGEGGLGPARAGNELLPSASLGGSLGRASGSTASYRLSGGVGIGQ